jgi:hypothetical protein
MMTKSKAILSIAIVLGMTCAASAATKRPIHHKHPVVAQEHLRAALQSYGSAQAG